MFAGYSCSFLRVVISSNPFTFTFGVILRKVWVIVTDNSYFVFYCLQLLVHLFDLGNP